MTRTLPFFAAITMVLLSEGPARAVGGVLGAGGQTVDVVDVRYALAMSPAQTTRWASLRVASFPSAMAWLLPVRPGARIEEVTDAWFDALELATAPRMVTAVCADGGAASLRVVTERRPSLTTSVRSLRTVILEDIPALRAFVQTWGFDSRPELEARFDEVAARGFAVLALVYAGPAEPATTRTVRITDDAFPWVPLFLTAAGNEPVLITTFAFADARARLGPGPELAIDGARIAVTGQGTTNYASELRALLLGAQGRSWIPEAASHELLFDGARGPAGVEPAPALAATYFRLAASDDHTDASDLTLALAGLDLSRAWLTRASGLVPPRTFGDDLAVTRRDAESLSPFVTAGGAPPSCRGADGGRVGPGGGPGDPIVPPRVPPSSPPPPTPPGTAVPPSSPAGPSSTSVGMSCACSPGPGPTEPTNSDDSCDGSDPGPASGPDEGCDGSADDGSDDSCGGSPGDDGGDNCAGSSSSGSGSDGGCSGGASEGGNGCSSGSSSSSEECSTTPHARVATRAHRVKASRPRLSVVTLAFTVVVLVFRRTTKRRR